MGLQPARFATLESVGPLGDLVFRTDDPDSLDGRSSYLTFIKYVDYTSMTALSN